MGGKMRGTKKRLRMEKQRLREEKIKRTVPYGREAYLAYLASDAWHALKLRYHASCLPKRCHACRAPWRDGFHFHHRTYKHLGREPLKDIMPICPDCHDALHWGLRQRRAQAAASGRKTSATFGLKGASKRKRIMKEKERRDAVAVPPK